MANQEVSPYDYFKFALSRMDRDIFGRSSLICATTNDLDHIGEFKDPVLYFPSKSGLDSFKLGPVRTDILVPDHDFFLVLSKRFMEQANVIRQENPHFEGPMLKNLMAEMALNRIWQKFQVRRKVLLGLGRIPAIEPISPEIMARCLEVEDITEEDCMDEMEAVMEAAREDAAQLPGHDNLSFEEAERRVTEFAEVCIINWLAKMHFRLSEQAAVRFLKRLMTAVDPLALRKSATE